MRVRDALYHARQTLASSGIEEAPLEAELLLMHSLGATRVQRYLQLEEEFPAYQSALLDDLLKRRLRHEPLAYIVGHKEFYGLDFLVDSRVLIPRPETELLVEGALAFAKHRFERGTCSIADIGTGSGAIAVALAVHLPQARVYATDISAEALAVAESNARRHGVRERITFLEGDLLEPLPQAVDIIAANLPYVRVFDLMMVGPEIRLYQPLVALEGGWEGLDSIERLLATAGEKLRPEGALFLEISYEQGEAVSSLAQRFFPSAHLRLVNDPAGDPRMLTVET